MQGFDGDARQFGEVANFEHGFLVNMLLKAFSVHSIDPPAREESRGKEVNLTNHAIQDDCC